MLKAPHTDLFLCMWGHTNTRTHTRLHSLKAVEWNNGQSRGIVGWFYHSHSFNHQPSVKCMYLFVFGCVCMRVWIHVYRCTGIYRDWLFMQLVTYSLNIIFLYINQFIHTRVGYLTLWLIWYVSWYIVSYPTQ